MDNIRVELKQAPEIKRVVQAAFPAYRKHIAWLRPFPASGVNINSYWDGGSKAEYAIVHLPTLQRRPLPSSTHPYFDVAGRGMSEQDTGVISSDHVGNLTLKVLPVDYILVSAGTFCGKPATATVYINPDNFSKLLPERG